MGDHVLSGKGRRLEEDARRKQKNCIHQKRGKNTYLKDKVLIHDIDYYSTIKKDKSKVIYIGISSSSALALSHRDKKVTPQNRGCKQRNCCEVITTILL